MPETSKAYKDWIEAHVVAFDCRYYPHNCQTVFKNGDAAWAFQRIAVLAGFATTCYWDGALGWGQDKAEYFMVQEWEMGDYRLVRRMEAITELAPPCSTSPCGSPRRRARRCRLLSLLFCQGSRSSLPENTNIRQIRWRSSEAGRKERRRRTLAYHRIQQRGRGLHPRSFQTGHHGRAFSLAA